MSDNGVYIPETPTPREASALTLELCRDFEEVLADPEALILVRDGLEVLRKAAVLDREEGIQGVRKAAVHLANSKGVKGRREALTNLAAACVVALATMPEH